LNTLPVPPLSPQFIVVQAVPFSFFLACPSGASGHIFPFHFFFSALRSTPYAAPRFVKRSLCYKSSSYSRSPPPFPLFFLLLHSVFSHIRPRFVGMNPFSPYLATLRLPPFCFLLPLSSRLVVFGHLPHSGPIFAQYAFFSLRNQPLFRLKQERSPTSSPFICPLMTWWTRIIFSPLPVLIMH